jgi:hypothetical protein
MRTEEESQRHVAGRVYADWAAVTPRLLPRLSLWKRPQTAFMLGRALSTREHQMFFAFVTCLTFLEIVADLNVKHRLGIDPLWGGLFGTSGVACASLTLIVQRRSITAASDVLPIPRRAGRHGSGEDQDVEMEDRPAGADRGQTERSHR